MKIIDGIKILTQPDEMVIKRDFLKPENIEENEIYIFQDDQRMWNVKCVNGNFVLQERLTTESRAILFAKAVRDGNKEKCETCKHFTIHEDCDNPKVWEEGYIANYADSITIHPDKFGCIFHEPKENK